MNTFHSHDDNETIIESLKKTEGLYRQTSGSIWDKSRTLNWFLVLVGCPLLLSYSIWVIASQSTHFDFPDGFAFYYGSGFLDKEFVEQATQQFLTGLPAVFWGLMFGAFALRLFFKRLPSVIGNESLSLFSGLMQRIFTILVIAFFLSAFFSCFVRR